MSKKFGPFIREIRIQKGLGQRELASKIGVSASYLNDIEKNKRTAPRIDLVNFWDKEFSNGSIWVFVTYLSFKAVAFIELYWDKKCGVFNMIIFNITNVNILTFTIVNS